MTVINNSESDNWQEAVTEWEIYDCEEDDSCSEECICGKENIKYLYTIRNVYNGRLLFPIGSSCIKKFNRTDLKEETVLIESQFTCQELIWGNDKEDMKYQKMGGNTDGREQES